MTGEVLLTVEGAVTQNSILDALESDYPMLRGTLREHGSGKRRPKVRFFANREDVTHQPPDSPLPDVIASGEQSFLIVGAISGG